MSRIYTIQFNAVAVTAQQDLFELTAAADRAFRLLSLELSQVTEVKEAEEEMLNILIKSGQTTSGSGGSAPTPIPIAVNNGAAGLAAEVNNTTKASAGTIVTHHVSNWNVRAPYLMIWPPEMRLEFAGARRMTIELATTPADSITMSGVVYVEEIG